MKILKIHRSKRWWTVVGISGFLVLGAISYSVYSLLSWQAYQERTVSWQHSTKQTLTTALSLKATSDTERSRKLAALKDTAQNLRKTQTNMCTPARLTGWQLVFDAAKAAREACGAYSQKVDGVTGQLDKVTAYLEDEAKVVAILQPAVALPKAVNEKDWDQTAASWGSVLAAVSSMTPSESFKPTKEQINSVIAGIDTSWKELMAAHSKKDKTSFVAAVSKLQKSYEAIAGITTVNATQLGILTSELQSLYNKL